MEEALNWPDWINMISSSIMAIFTIVIAIFSCLVWKIYKRILFSTSAAETHSDMMLKLKAIEQGIPIYWWDPTIEAPPVGWKHGEKIDLKRIHFYMPKELRKNKMKVPLTHED